MSEDQRDAEGRGFTVKDRRGIESEAADEQHPAGQAGPTAGADGLPEIDFSTFVLSLSTSALVHLGESPDPDGAQHKDLVLAKQTIDIIAMLRDKTHGNLSAEESRLLEELLYDLRMRYVSAAR